MKIDGRAIAQALFSQLKADITYYKQENDRSPQLAVIFIGDNPDSQLYIKQKQIAAEKIGISFSLHKFTKTAKPEAVEKLVISLASDPAIDALIVQRPLPDRFSTERLTKLVTPKKDVDGFLPDSPFTPPIALAVFKILKEIFKGTSHPAELASKNVLKDFAPELMRWLNAKKIVLIGRGETAGVPIANTFNKNGLRFTQVHSQTKHKEKLIKQADILVSAVGKSGIVTPDAIKKGVILIGIGIETKKGNLVGDYEEKEISEVASFYTPTPGGTGPVNVASLMQNVVEATQK